ncbi:hypothetical protein MS3_00009715 [Schistosoma haematobium]|uniref:Uncharacterized protein n=2 Tax=Schistosoma haematobium TaxID=6185 RepID=A0A922IIJ7_SCHHA|nr:hypothetical protein MS3_00009715 [Schistosoma haematobium]KAH9579624.1 hypothetical protein MS3_00009715 [Schistosoma haematobium]
MKLEPASNKRNAGHSTNPPKSDVNRTITTNLCGWSEQNAFDSVCLKPACRTTGSNVMGGVGCGKSERFSYQKPTRIGKQYKFYHYDDPHAYILQYRRDCTLNSSSKDHNQDKGPVEEFNKSIVVEMDAKNYNHSEKSDISQINNESFSEQPHLKSTCITTTTTTTNNFQPQLSEIKVKSTKSTLNSTTTTTTTVSGNRHLWVNNCPTGPGRNNHMNKVSNADTSNKHVSQMKQKSTKKESIIKSHYIYSSQLTSGQFSDKTDMNSNGSNYIPVLRIKSATKLNVESTNYITTIQQTIRDANHPEFWPLLYKKLIHLQAERANQTEEEK